MIDLEFVTPPPIIRAPMGTAEPNAAWWRWAYPGHSIARWDDGRGPTPCPLDQTPGSIPRFGRVLLGAQWVTGLEIEKIFNDIDRWFTTETRNVEATAWEYHYGIWRVLVDDGTFLNIHRTTIQEIPEPRQVAAIRPPKIAGVVGWQLMGWAPIGPWKQEYEINPISWET